MSQAWTESKPRSPILNMDSIRAWVFLKMLSPGWFSIKCTMSSSITVCMSHIILNSKRRRNSKVFDLFFKKTLTNTCEVTEHLCNRMAHSHSI